MKLLKLSSILIAISFFFFSGLEAKSQDKAIKEVVYKSDIKGPGCVNKVSTALLETEGIENTSIDLASKTIKIKYNAGTTNKAKIEETIAKAGYTANETKDYKGKSSACCDERKVQKTKCCGK